MRCLSTGQCLTKSLEGVLKGKGQEEVGHVGQLDGGGGTGSLKGDWLQRRIALYVGVCPRTY